MLMLLPVVCLLGFTLLFRSREAGPEGFPISVCKAYLFLYGLMVFVAEFLSGFHLINNSSIVWFWGVLTFACVLICLTRKPGAWNAAPVSLR